MSKPDAATISPPRRNQIRLRVRESDILVFMAVLPLSPDTCGTGLSHHWGNEESSQMDQKFHLNFENESVSHVARTTCQLERGRDAPV
jgi:hypothetical protein